ncbi:hypothetical protein Tco_1268717, partial [Tanacetum coccineum]
MSKLAPPPRQRTSPERDNSDIVFSDQKHMSAQEMSNNLKMDGDQKRNCTKDETVIDAVKQYFLMFLLEGKAVAMFKGSLKLVVTLKSKIHFLGQVTTVELYAMKDALVGIPGVSGLSTKQ